MVPMMGPDNSGLDPIPVLANASTTHNSDGAQGLGEGQIPPAEPPSPSEGWAREKHPCQHRALHVSQLPGRTTSPKNTCEYRSFGVCE